jgi:hypothetical protein
MRRLTHLEIHGQFGTPADDIVKILASMRQLKWLVYLPVSGRDPNKRLKVEKFTELRYLACDARILPKNPRFPVLKSLLLDASVRIYA